MTPHNSDKVYMDLTGPLPHQSSRGHKYILINYHADSNTILGCPLKNRQASTITEAKKQLEDTLSICNASINT